MINFQIRSTDSIDSGFHSLTIGVGPPGKMSGGHNIGHMTRSLQYNCDNIGQCQMVRYRGGDQVSSGPRYTDHRRHRSRSRDRQRHKYTESYTPVISDYLNSPMFDSLHQKHNKHNPTISLLSSRSSHHRKYGIGQLGGSNKHSQPISIISQCKVL